MTSRILVGGALLVAVTALAGGARGEASPEAREHAREHAERARRHFDLGQFEEALAAYTTAYEAAPAPGVLFNMGQCHRQLGHHERALFFFRGYLRALPDAPNHVLVEELIARSEQELAGLRSSAERRAEEERLRAEQERRAAEQERLRAERERRAAEAARLDAEAAAARDAAGRGTRASTPYYRSWWFWTVVGAVVVGGVAAGAVGATWEPAAVLPQGSLGTIDGR